MSERKGILLRLDPAVHDALARPGRAGAARSAAPAAREATCPGNPGLREGYGASGTSRAAAPKTTAGTGRPG